MYIKMFGTAGLEQATSTAILNANYMAAQLNGAYDAQQYHHKTTQQHQQQHNHTTTTTPQPQKTQQQQNTTTTTTPQKNITTRTQKHQPNNIGSSASTGILGW